jgi:hypothetical protein
MTRPRLLAVLVVVLVPRAAGACPICFGAADSALLHGARSGVLAMAAITVVVLAAFARWFLRLRRLERARESS